MITRSNHLGHAWLIDRVTPVKVDAAVAHRGLHTELHGEVAYLDN
ncbi:hypothetical protein [Trinickia mobilis]|nr:hypothetical protein [Trinickia mobilis]